MNRETIEKIFNFLKEKEGKELPQKWKLIHELENHPDGTQYRYKGNLVLSNSNITKLPDNLFVYGWLDLENCKQIKELPKKLFVSRSLYMEGCEQLKKLPDNLHIGGSLILEGSKITELPKKLYVGGYLNLADCKQLTELPDNLYVGGDLGIYNTPIAQKYSNKEIREMITSKGGTLIGKISR